MTRSIIGGLFLTSDPSLYASGDNNGNDVFSRFANPNLIYFFNIVLIINLFLGLYLLNPRHLGDMKIKTKNKYEFTAILLILSFLLGLYLEVYEIWLL